MSPALKLALHGRLIRPLVKPLTVRARPIGRQVERSDLECLRGNSAVEGETMSDVGTTALRFRAGENQLRAGLWPYAKIPGKLESPARGSSKPVVSHDPAFRQFPFVSAWEKCRRTE